MHGLITLMKGKNEAVVAESVIAIKKLLQTGTKDHDSVISYFAKKIETIQIPDARASMIWVIGEYCEKIPLLAPDVLRQLAKSFPEEESVVKLQVLNLGAKLHLTNPEQTTQLFLYVLNMAKYDSNYDIRDKARVMRTILLSTDAPKLSARAKELFMSKKPTPQNRSPSEERLRWALGSLSALVKHTAFGYQELPDFPEVAPDPAVRNVVVISGKATGANNFYNSDSDYDSDRSYGSDRSYDSDYSRSRSRSRSSSGSRSRSSSRSRSRSRSPVGSDRSYDSYSDDSRSDSDRSYSSDSDDDRRNRKKKKNMKSTRKTKKEAPKKETKPKQPEQPVPLQTKKTFVTRGAPKAAPQTPASPQIIPTSTPQPQSRAQTSKSNLVDDFLGKLSLCLTIQSLRLILVLLFLFFLSFRLWRRCSFGTCSYLC
jgi:AP-3 complex subunit beta